MDRLYPLSVDTPAGTTPLLPQSTTWRLEDAKLVSVTFVIPDGHSGLTGIRLLQAGQQIVPYSNDDWFVSNDEIIDVPVNMEMTTSGLTVQTYNTDVFTHRHWLRALITDLQAAGSALAAPIPVIASDILSGTMGL